MLSALGRQVVRKALTKSVGNVSVNSVRQASGVWMYRRVGPLDSKADIVQVTSFMSFVWYWVFYHCLTEPEHLYGHWIPPKPKEFTDAELGIPDINDENPAPCDMRVRQERPRFLPTNMVDLYHEYYGGTRILPRRAAYASGGAEEEVEEEDDDEEC